MLRLENVSKSFDRVIFDKLNISFPNKGFVLIMGESGSGKSTLLNLILGLENCDEGNVIYNETILKKKDFINFRKNEISCIFQDYGLIDYYTIKQNLLLPLISIKNKITDEDLKRVLLEVGIDKKLNTLCKYLSGGEAQKVAIARSMLLDKNIYLCDEPTGSLDKDNGEKVLSILKQISKDKLVICVSHNEEYQSKYADYTFSLSSKKWIGYSPSSNTTSIINHYENKNVSLLTRLKLSFLSLKRRVVRSIVSLISCSLIFFILLVSLSLSSSGITSLNDCFTNYLNYNMLQVSSLYQSSTSGDFSINKVIRPDINVLKNNIKDYDCSLTYNLNDLFSNATFKKNNKEFVVNFVPFNYLFDTKYSIYLDVMNKMTYQEVFVNKQAYQLIKNTVTMNIKKSIKTTQGYTSKSLDNIDISINLKAIKVIDEFDFLSTPTIYYNYYSYQKYLSNIVLNNASSLLGRKVTVFDRYSTLSNNQENISSYSYLLWANESDVLKIYTYLISLGYDVFSNAIENRNSILDIVEISKNVINIFLLICSIIVFCLMNLIIYSLIIDRTREIVLLKINGINNKQVNKIICLDTVLICIISSLLVNIIIQLLLPIINQVIYNYLFIENFLKIDMNVSIILSLCSVLFGYICSKIPLFLLHKKKESELLMGL